MINIYWHDDAGRILQAAFNAGEESAAVAASSPGRTVFVSAARTDNINLAYISDGELREMPARPSPEHTWDYASQAWVDARTLDAVKAQRWAQIKAQRDAVEFGGFTWSGDEFDSDAESQARIMGAVQMALIAAQAEQPFAIDWTLADNTVRSMSAADIVSAGLALGEHVAAAHGVARTLRAAIDACTTAAEVEAVAWP